MRKMNTHDPLHFVKLEGDGRECRDVGNTLDQSRHHCGSFGSGQWTVVMIAPRHTVTLSQPSSLSRTNTNLIPINSTPDTITITKAIIITNVK